MSNRLYPNKEERLNFCRHCGADLSAFKTPTFCVECGARLVSTPAVNETKDWSHWDEVLGEDVSVYTAVSRFMSRFWKGSSSLEIGVIIRTAGIIEASLAIHDEGLQEQLARLTRESAVLPGNCCLHPDGELRLWRDAQDRLVSRAAAAAYYVFGVGMSRKWHIGVPLQAQNRNALVTVEENRMDFKLVYADDMDQKKFELRLLESMSQLEAAIGSGISTKAVKLAPAGQMSSIVLFVL
jgi:hypothetical protein